MTFVLQPCYFDSLDSQRQNAYTIDDVLFECKQGALPRLAQSAQLRKTPIDISSPVAISRYTIKEIPTYISLVLVKIFNIYNELYF